MDWFQILVIILSVLLGLFLVSGIVLVVIVIKLTQQIKSLADGAKTAVDKVSLTAKTVSRATSPDYIGRYIAKFVTKLKEK